MKYTLIADVLIAQVEYYKTYIGNNIIRNKYTCNKTLSQSLRKSDSYFRI